MSEMRGWWPDDTGVFYERHGKFYRLPPGILQDTLNEHYRENAAPRSCARCRFETTCGYSPLAMTGHRGEGSNIPCVLCLKSNGEPFFQPRNAEDGGHLSMSADLREALDLLRDLQWAGTDDDPDGGTLACCPVCGAEQRSGQHFEGCRLAETLTQHDPWPTGDLIYDESGGVIGKAGPLRAVEALGRTRGRLP